MVNSLIVSLFLASLPSHLTATSPHNCLSVRASPITGISPFYQTAEQLKPRLCETQYRPVQGILPPTPTTPPHYYRDALLYTPHDCILPLSPPDHGIHRQGDHGENKGKSMIQWLVVLRLSGIVTPHTVTLPTINSHILCHVIVDH